MNQLPGNFLEENANDVRFWELVDIICINESDEAEIHELESLMLANPELQPQYMNYCRMDAEVNMAIKARAAGEKTLTMFDGFTEEAKEELKADSTVHSTQNSTHLGFLSHLQGFGHLQSIGKWLSHPIQISIGIAFVVILSTLVTFSLIYIQNNPNHNDVAQTPEDVNINAKRVAYLTKLDQCVWGGQIKRHHGDDIFTGETLNLKQGTAELYYQNGATVLLQAPVSFRVDSEKSGTLLAGKITTRVTTESYGYVVNTRAVNIVDLGTQFSVEVSDENHTYLMVSEGKVQVGAIDKQGDVVGKKYILGAGQAMLFNYLGKSENVPPRPNQFKVVSVRKGSTTILGGKLSKFRNAQQLDLEGNLVWALNIGSSVDESIRGTQFTSDNKSRKAGAVIASDRSFQAMGSKPEYGDTVDDNALERMMHSSRYGSTDKGHLPDDIKVELPLPDGIYKIQILISDNIYGARNPTSAGHRRKLFDISLEGKHLVKKLAFPQQQETWDARKGEVPHVGLVYTYTTRVTDGKLNIRLHRATLSSTTRDIESYSLTSTLNALTVERVAD